MASLAFLVKENSPHLKKKLEKKGKGKKKEGEHQEEEELDLECLATLRHT